MAPSWLRLIILTLGALGITWLWQSMETWAWQGLRTPESSTDPGRTIRDDLFWLLSLPALIFSYTTFESFYRGRDNRFLTLLPIDARAYFTSVLVGAFVRHVPLFLPAAFYSIHLARLGGEGLGTYGLLWTGLTFLMAIPLSLAMHVAAGQAGLGGPSRIKDYLASGIIANDSAYLLYSPVAALASVVTLGIFTDMLLFESLVTHRANLVWAPVGWSLLLAFASFRHARQVCRVSFFPMIATFREADTPLSYGDDGIPTPSRRLLFSGRLRGVSHLYFQRDDTQLRRRHRLDKVLLVAFALFLLKTNLSSDAPAAVIQTCLYPLLVFSTVFLIPSFRSHGQELDSSWLRASLPHSAPHRWVGGTFADLVFPFWAWVIAVLNAGIFGQAMDAALVAGVGISSILALVVSARWAAALGEPRQAQVLSIAWRLSCLTLFGGLSWIL